MKLSPYVRAAVAAVGALSVAFSPVVADDVLSTSEVDPVVAAVVTAGLALYSAREARRGKRKSDPES